MLTTKQARNIIKTVLGVQAINAYTNKSRAKNGAGLRNLCTSAVNAQQLQDITSIMRLLGHTGRIRVKTSTSGSNTRYLRICGLSIN